MQADFVSNALGLSLSSSPKTFSKVTSDSRKVSKDDLFVALSGDQYDGHSFVQSAIEKGATGIIVNSTFDTKTISPSVQVFSVKSTLDAYRSLAYAYRKTFQIPFIAVAGSVGKTTTKELLSAILSGKFESIHKTQGSQNGFIGIPMTLLELKPEHKASVIEIGIDDIGAMKEHIPIIEPDAAVLSAIGPEHLENLKNLETVAFEESIALRETLKRGGKIAVNLDDPYIARLASELESPRTFTYAIEKTGAPFRQGERHVSAQVDSSQKTLIVKSFSSEIFELTLPLPGQHNAMNLLSAVSVALMIGLSPVEIKKGLATFQGVSGRSEVRIRDGHTFVCDYYNANPTSMKAAFSMALSLKPEWSHYACLADMLELGTDEERYHRELATDLVNQEWEHIFLFGSRMKWLVNELGAKDFNRFTHFESKADLKKALELKLKSPSVILIKGSRSMKMEEVF